MSKKKKSFLAPPADLSLAELLRFIWDHGVGQAFNADGDPRPWRDGDLEAAFDECGYDITRRSIQSWMSGRAIPTVKNLHALARVVSDGDMERRHDWARALIAARSKLKRDSAAAETPAAEPAVDRGGDIGASAPTAPAVSRGQRMILAAAIAAAALLGLGALGTYMAVSGTLGASPSARNLRICDEARFSKRRKLCLENVAEFPSGVKLLYVSFRLDGAKEGQAFERRWFRDGEQYAVRKSYYDAAWSGWTYQWLDEGYADGRYALRVIIDGHVTTTTFVVGKEPDGVPDWIIERHQ